MTCLHVLCRDCLPQQSVRGDYQQNGSVFLCPACRPKSPGDVPQVRRKSVTSQVNSRVSAKPCLAIEELKRRSEAANGWYDDTDEDSNDDAGEEEDEEGCSSEVAPEVISGSSLVLPCPAHAQRDAEQYCLACDQLACQKCVTSTHRKCSQQLVTCPEAVVARRPHLNALHSKLAQKVIRSQEHVTSDSALLEDLEKQRLALIGQIAAQREALVRAILEKEARLVQEVNAVLDKETNMVKARIRENTCSGKAAEGQLSVLEAVISVQVFCSQMVPTIPLIPLTIPLILYLVSIQFNYNNIISIPILSEGGS